MTIVNVRDFIHTELRNKFQDHVFISMAILQFTPATLTIVCKLTTELAHFQTHEFYLAKLGISSILCWRMGDIAHLLEYALPHRRRQGHLVPLLWRSAQIPTVGSARQRGGVGRT